MKFRHIKFRKWVLRLHGLIGIVMGLLLVVMGLTGSMIVFQEELDHALNRSLWSVVPQSEQVSLDAMLAPVQAAHPQLPVQFIQVPKEPSGSYVFNQEMAVGQRLQTFVNPYTGEVLGTRIWERSLLGFLYTLHEELFLGTPGMIIVGISGVCLLSLTVTGVFLWTGWRRLATGFNIRWRASPELLNYDIHNVGGIVSNIFLMILAATGVVIVVLHVMPTLSPSPQVQKAPLESSISLSELLRKADAALPESQTTFIELSETNPQQLTVRKKLPDQETGRFDFSTVELDRSSGEIVQVSKVKKAEGFFKVVVMVAALHFGSFGGLPTRILYLFIGFMPTGLLITGLVNWKRRRRLGVRREIVPRLVQETQQNRLP